MQAPHRDHPRILIDSGGLERLRHEGQAPPFAPLVDTLTAQAAADLAEPLPTIELADDLYVEGGEIWEVRYLMEGQAGLDRAAVMGRPYGVTCGQIPRQAFAYRITGEGRHLQRAAEALAALAALPMPATGYANTHTFHGATSALATGLDLLWDDLDTGPRADFVEALVARASELHDLSVRVALRDPLDSHAIMYGPPAMLHAALALYHHRPEAAAWLDDVIEYFTAAFPGFGGDDGGWGQGFGYGDGVHQQTIHTLWQATGIDLSASAWGRNNPLFMLYFQPPCGITPLFGDAGYARPKGLQKRVMANYARIHQAPHYSWFAEQIEAPWQGDELFQLSMHLTRPAAPPARAPHDLPQARHQRDIGWVALHGCLADGARNVSLYFKSSPFGSYSHSHADQNSLVVTACGQPLLIDSGYYPWYASPHDMAWTRQTRAHNAVLVNGKGQGVCNRAAGGRVIAFTHGADFDYTAGDATAAYREPSLTTDTTSHHLRRDFHAPMELCAYYEGVRRMVRHVVFVRPGAFVLLDEVETEAPASVQLLWHAHEAFAIDAARHRADIAHGGGLARLHFLTPGACQLSQTDRFPVPPEHDLPNQWHLTADWGATTARRRLLTVIQACAADAGDRLPEVCGLDEEDVLGVRVGATTVRFELEGGVPRVTAEGIRPDGTPTWFQHTGVGFGAADWRSPG